MSSWTRAASFAACSARAAFSRRHTCHGPGEVGRAARDELHRRGRRRLEEPAVVRDEDDRGVEADERLLEPLEALDVEVVRRLVEQQQVGVGAERAAERGARQLAAGERPQRPVEVVAPRSRALEAPMPRARASSSRRRARAAPASPSSGAASARRDRPPPSPARAAAAPARARRGRPRPRARTRAGCGPRGPAAAGRAARSRVPFSNASSPPCSSVSPASTRSSVVLPAPFGPASASRSPRSTLNETLSKSRLPANSLRRPDAITTAIPVA